MQEEVFRLGSIYDANVWESMNGKRNNGYAVCVEGKILSYTKDRDHPLEQGQFLVDTRTLMIVEDTGLKERFDKLHKRLTHNN